MGRSSVEFVVCSIIFYDGIDKGPVLIERSTYFHANFVKDRTGLTTISRHMLLYTNIDQKLRNKIHGPLHALNHKCYVCIQWTQCMYIYIYTML